MLWPLRHVCVTVIGSESGKGYKISLRSTLFSKIVKIYYQDDNQRTWQFSSSWYRIMWQYDGYRWFTPPTCESKLNQRKLSLLVSQLSTAVTFVTMSAAFLSIPVKLICPEIIPWDICCRFLNNGALWVEWRLCVSGVITVVCECCSKQRKITNEIQASEPSKWNTLLEETDSPFVQLSDAQLYFPVKSLVTCLKSKNKHAVADWHANKKHLSPSDLQHWAKAALPLNLLQKNPLFCRDLCDQNNKWILQ